MTTTWKSVLSSRDGGEESLVTCDYLVAADGVHSRIRQQLGIDMGGRGSFANCVTIYFKADVKPLLGDRNLSVVYVNHPSLLGFFRFSISGDSGFLAVFSTIAPDGTRDTQIGDDVSTERCTEWVRTALGCAPDHPVEIENVQRWSASAATASTFSSGRIFLAGDSAHVMPPTGGFGGNTGVADAHNLAWKLALVTNGLAGPDLLSSYDEERRPVAALTVEQAYTRYVLRVDPSLPQDDLQPPLDDASIELGAVYRPGAPLDDPREHSWTPGARVPHVRLSEGRSTLDVAGHGFALLTAGDADDWHPVADEAQQAVGVTLAVESVAEPNLAGTVLVRPDGVIAWHTQEVAAAELTDALLGLLHREPRVT